MINWVAVDNGTEKSASEWVALVKKMVTSPNLRILSIDE